MKFSKTLILAFAISGIFTESANASCPRQADSLICPGDTAVSSDNVFGIVVGVNPDEGTVSIKNPWGDIYTRNKHDVAIGKGCLEGYCVGDVAVWDGYRIGQIAGVNPYAREIALRTLYGDIATEDIVEVGVGEGCLLGFCMGDTVVSRDDGISGIVVAVNPFRNWVSLRSRYGYVYTRRIRDLTSSGFCDRYSSNERSHHRFPVLDEKLFNFPDLKFSWERPVANH